MTIWHIHFLNARNDLTGVMAEIRAIARQTVGMVEARHDLARLDLPRFDLLVRAVPGIDPDCGIQGQTPAPGVIELHLDPARVTADALCRTLLRQMHHLIRQDGPGRSMGGSLGEALVAEGLAGHFVQQMLGGAPDLRDQTRPGAGSLRQAANLWARRDASFDEWFLGRGKIRKGTGYGIGYRLVSEHLDQNVEEDALTLAQTPADSFRPAMRRLLAIEGIELPEDETETETGAGVEPPVEAADKAEIASRDAGGPAPRTPGDISGPMQG
ncbi:DUF2268 domain-containing protein [Paracoccus nototheniae]|uniref:DUF2268 domain-containing putative Zn-dependent protease n=1 Tax=Paracoccus nototheniae TaxID=2489002 RepID=A0ABW4DUU1_9RHOB|nr:DUF2268 domain-containing putative Zn-dependent protease [Paracoccus nototheniae]